MQIFVSILYDLCRFSLKPSKSILNGAQCVAEIDEKNGLDRFLNEIADLLSNPFNRVKYFFTSIVNGRLNFAEHEKSMNFLGDLV